MATHLSGSSLHIQSILNTLEEGNLLELHEVKHGLIKLLAGPCRGLV